MAMGWTRWALGCVAVAALAAAAAAGGGSPAAAQAEEEALLVRRGEGAAGELYRVPLDGGAAVRLTRNRASDYFAVASPDGRRIAFVVPGPGRADDGIAVMAPG